MIERCFGMNTFEQLLMLIAMTRASRSALRSRIIYKAGFESVGQKVGQKISIDVFFKIQFFDIAVTN